MKFTLEQATKSQMGSGGIALLFFHLGARWGWVVNAMSPPLYPWERRSTHCIVGWVGPRAGLDMYRKSRPTGIRSLDSSARSDSLYRLRYPGPLWTTLIYTFAIVMILKSIVFHQVKLCSPVEIYGCSGGKCRFHIQTIGNTLMMETASSSETSANLFQTTVKPRIYILVGTTSNSVKSG